MYRMTIVYSRPDDVAEFRRYYDEVHIPLARRMQGLAGWNLVWIDDPASDACLIAELYTGDKATMDAMLASPEGQAANQDLENFVTAPVAFLTGYEEQVELS
ncbi:EthD family reductase [Microbacterium sp. CIAB417]|uniref:EthD family reductase n=1 Tax=Microbacterium sp. CIAB417 TaxID=2860287 RepID=UPI001FAB71F4|nr:EthD family reductase [Microbacterium sp. CIAB417]